MVIADVGFWLAPSGQRSIVGPRGFDTSRYVEGHRGSMRNHRNSLGSVNNVFPEQISICFNYDQERLNDSLLHMSSQTPSLKTTGCADCDQVKGALHGSEWKDWQCQALSSA